MKIPIFALVILLTFSRAEAEEAWAPDFLIIGAQKAGTTALYHLITQHPRIVKRRGEIHFFDWSFKRGVAWYKQQFPLRPSPEYLVGEKSPYYMFHPLVAERVHSLYPKVKIMLLLRNPVDRAYSQYWHNIRNNNESLTFAEAIEAEPSRLEGVAPNSYNHRNYSYLARGVYVDQIKSWLDLFPKEQILVLSAAELRKNPRDVLNSVFSFLGLNSYSVVVDDPESRSDYPPMDSELRKQLVEYFEPFNHQLEELLEVKFNWL